MTRKSLSLRGLEYKLLGMLLVQKRHGWEILQKVNLDYKELVKFGAMYKALRKLEREGFLESAWGDASEVTGGARRRYYWATASGRQIYVDFRQEIDTQPYETLSGDMEPAI